MVRGATFPWGAGVVGAVVGAVSVAVGCSVVVVPVFVGVGAGVVSVTVWVVVPPVSCVELLPRAFPPPKVVALSPFPSDWPAISSGTVITTTATASAIAAVANTTPRAMRGRTGVCGGWRYTRTLPAPVHWRRRRVGIRVGGLGRPLRRVVEDEGGLVARERAGDALAGPVQQLAHQCHEHGGERRGDPGAGDPELRGHGGGRCGGRACDYERARVETALALLLALTRARRRSHCRRNIAR